MVNVSIGWIKFNCAKISSEQGNEDLMPLIDRYMCFGLLISCKKHVHKFPIFFGSENRIVEIDSWEIKYLKKFQSFITNLIIITINKVLSII